jgi:GrpB-like predicted nucleotidyltransferase (UPF0157 family)
MLKSLAAAGLGMGSEGVVLREHDPRWCAAFAALAIPGIALYHVRSKAVPTLAVKAILDVLGVTESLAAFDARSAEFVALGFTWEGENGISGRRYLVLLREGITYMHLHVFALRDPEIAKHFAFRDALIDSPSLPAEYATVKRGLALRYVADRVQYTNGKNEFIQRVLAG